MATLSKDPNGHKRIGFAGPDGRRHTVRLGKVPLKAAETARGHIEELLAARMTASAPPPRTSQWLAELPDVLHNRLARAGLIDRRENTAGVTLGEMISACLEANGGKPSTLTRMRQAERALVAHFGAEADPRSIDAAAAEDWQAELRSRYARATVSRTIIYARQFFTWARRRRFVDANPFEGLRPGPQTNPDRQVFIDRATIARVIDAAPDAEWRVVIALGRFGGLRLPSEALALTWADVDWERDRLWVRSAKTEHHAGGEGRWVPLFPEVQEPLRELYEQAKPGDERVLARYRDGANLNTHLRRIILRAGVTPWPRTLHNLRASRQTELAAEFPLATVCAWIGNTKAVAAGHYLQVTDADWRRAVGGKSGAESDARPTQNATLHADAPVRTETTDASQTPVYKGSMRAGAPRCNSTRNGQVGVTGLEPVTSAV